MGRQYKLAEQTIDEEDIQDLIAWLKTNPWLIQGELARAFERQWAEWLSVKYATFVNSGSSANLLMYDSLLLSEKLPIKKIVLPAVSWATSVAPAIQSPVNESERANRFVANEEDRLRCEAANRESQYLPVSVPRRCRFSLPAKRPRDHLQYCFCRLGSIASALRENCSSS